MGLGLLVGCRCGLGVICLGNWLVTNGLGDGVVGCRLIRFDQVGCLLFFLISGVIDGRGGALVILSKDKE